ncbi:MAG: CBS domain-containing protein [Ectothiorhodospiraceae bacterium]|nr:CBS domain-containing protein [Ectothiorhodospiraceae bacterium]
MYEFVKYRVADIMTRSPVTVRAEATLADAQALFEQYGFNGLPVVNEAHELRGVVTKMDVLKAFTLRPETIVPRYDEIMRSPVSEVMTHSPVAVSPDTPCTRVLQRLVDMRIKSLPVVEDGRLVGVVAREDVLAALREATSGS